MGVNQEDISSAAFDSNAICNVYHELRVQAEIPSAAYISEAICNIYHELHFFQLIISTYVFFTNKLFFLDQNDDKMKDGQHHNQLLSADTTHFLPV